MVTQAVSTLSLFAVMVTTESAVTIRAVPDEVSVRRGEPLELSCGIEYEAATVVHTVRWYRGIHSDIYGEINVATRCGAVHLACPAVHTTDERGIIRFERGRNNDATLTLAIDSSSFADSMTFYCGIIIKGVDGAPLHESSAVYVSVTRYTTTGANPAIPGTTRDAGTLTSTVPNVDATTTTAPKTDTLISTTRDVKTTTVTPPNPTTSENGVQTSLANQKSTQQSEGPSSAEYSPNLTSSSPAKVAQPTFPSPTGSVVFATASFTRHQTLRASTPSDRTTPSLMSTDPVPSPRTLLLAVAGGAGGVIIILLGIVSYLVASRKKANGRDNRYTDASISQATVPDTRKTNIQGTRTWGYQFHKSQGRHELSSDTAIAPGEYGPTGPSSPSPAIAYEVVPLFGLRQSPPPEDASDDNLCDFRCTKTWRQDRSEDTASAEEIVVRHKAPLRQDLWGRERTADNPKVRRPGPAGSPAVPRRDDSDSSSIYDCDRKFVDNVLYAASSDSAIVREQKFGQSVLSSQNKVKGKPRLDPF
ncbi:uncharacterized protein LOC110988212 [Acanthaster planci]|uniref:Uncharacterized protein LOC110988212 n=1 Tax=Acanthaster planci TaxID=133434 RepID=A0A8B7ZQ84_ACAPL|nr:uncharacterized protein LOC110988212 [Acanthaster planci]